MRGRRPVIGPSVVKVALACVAMLAIIVTGGCGTAHATEAKGVGGTDAMTEVGSAALPVIKGSELWGGKDRSRSEFETSNGDGARMLLEQSGPEEGGGLTQSRSLFDGKGETPQRKQTLRVRDDGAVALVEEINHAEKVEVVFDPPLVVLPARIERGTETTSKGQMTVHPLGDRKRVRAKGAFTGTIRVDRAAKIRTPAGEFVAWKLVSHLSADLGPSRVSNETESWIVPGLGLVVERRREQTNVMGVKVRDNADGWVIVKPPATRKR